MKFKISHAATVFTFSSALLSAIACSSTPQDAEMGLEEDIGVRQSELRKGTPGATVGDSNYCDNPLAPCTLGEGDCDSSAGCDAGLVCGRNKRLQFAGPGDACVPAHCINKVRDADETQIDCGGECGSICATPVCGPNGSQNRCTTDCPCAIGEGDCDSSTQCTSGLVCGYGKLKQFGFPGGDSCVPSHCTNRKQDGNETQIDCGGDCGSVCVSTQPPSADKVVFVSSRMFTGNLGGLAGADASCQSMATMANLSGTYKAFLSDSVDSASARLTRGAAAYVLVGGTVVATSAAQFFSNNHAAPIDRDENGTLTGGEVWTGTWSGDGDGSGGCSDWTSTDETAIVGLNFAADSQWVSVYEQFCDRNNVRLYCVQQ